MSEVTDAKKFFLRNNIKATAEDCDTIQAFIDVIDRMGCRVMIEPKPKSAYYSWVDGSSPWVRNVLRDLTMDELYSYKACDFMRLRNVGSVRADKIVRMRTAFIRSHPELFKDGKPINELS